MLPAVPTAKVCELVFCQLRLVIPAPASVDQVGVPPLIVSTCPVDPSMSPTVFPVLVSPLLKLKRSVNCPVVLLYPTPFEPEREVREILVATDHEREFTVVVRALTVPERLNTVHERERKLVASVLTLPERLKREPERLRIFPVAVESEFERARRFPVAVAR